MSKEQYEQDRAELNALVLDAIRTLDPDRKRSMALGDVLLAYGVKILVEEHGNEVVAKHLASLAARFAEGRSFDETANLN